MRLFRSTQACTQHDALGEGLLRIGRLQHRHGRRIHMVSGHSCCSVSAVIICGASKDLELVLYTTERHWTSPRLDSYIRATRRCTAAVPIRRRARKFCHRFCGQGIECRICRISYRERSSYLYAGSSVGRNLSRPGMSMRTNGIADGPLRVEP